MKTASAGTQTNITSGAYLKVELWQLTLQNNGSPLTYYFTAGDTALTVAGNTYVTGLNILRDSITTRRGIQPSSLTLTIVPQADNPGGPVTIAGGQFVAQAAAGVLDGASWLMSKAFFAIPPAGYQIDTSPGLVPWWGGVTGTVNSGRFLCEVDIEENTALLTNVMMPRNLIQAGCVHTLFDAGCTLLKSNNTYTGTLTAVSGNTLTTSLAPGTYADGYFNLGIIKFTSGALNGTSFTVQASSHTGGNVTVTTIRPFPTAPSAGDSFSIIPGCDKSVAMCSSSKFKLPGGSFGSNILHYRGAPFVPNPETLYDGGTGSQTYASIGKQGTPIGGSTYTGKR